MIAMQATVDDIENIFLSILDNKLIANEGILGKNRASVKLSDIFIMPHIAMEFALRGVKLLSLLVLQTINTLDTTKTICPLIWSACRVTLFVTTTYFVDEHPYYGIVAYELPNFSKAVQIAFVILRVGLPFVFVPLAITLLNLIITLDTQHIRNIITICRNKFIFETREFNNLDPSHLCYELLSEVATIIVNIFLICVGLPNIVDKTVDSPDIITQALHLFKTSNATLAFKNDFNAMCTYSHSLEKFVLCMLLQQQTARRFIQPIELGGRDNTFSVAFNNFVEDTARINPPISCNYTKSDLEAVKAAYDKYESEYVSMEDCSPLQHLSSEKHKKIIFFIADIVTRAKSDSRVLQNIYLLLYGYTNENFNLIEGVEYTSIYPLDTV